MDAKSISRIFLKNKLLLRGKQKLSIHIRFSEQPQMVHACMRSISSNHEDENIIFFGKETTIDVAPEGRVG